MEEPIAQGPADVNARGFRDGARAMFDALAYRVANHWHPRHQEACDRDNAWVMEWASNALEEVSPDDCAEWKAIHQAWAEGFDAGKRAAWLEHGNNGDAK